MLLVGGFEGFAAGWVYGIEDQIESLGDNIVLTYIGTTFGSIVLACCLWFGISDADTAIWAGFVVRIAFYAIGMMLVVLLVRKKMKSELERVTSWKNMLYELMLKNVMTLKDDLSAVVDRLLSRVHAYFVGYSHQVLHSSSGVGAICKFVQR